MTVLTDGPIRQNLEKYYKLSHSKPLPFTGNINIIQSSEFDERQANVPYFECPDTKLKFIIDSGSNTS